MTFKPLAALWMAMACLVLPTAALAVPVNHTFNGTFNGGSSTGTYSGSFTYETTTQKVTTASVTVSAGLSDDGAPRSVATYNTVADSSVVHFTVTNAPIGMGNRTFVLVADTDNFGSATPVLSMAYDGRCTNAPCTGINQADPGTSSSSPPIALNQPQPAPVPTMSEWAMIVMGLMLAGVAAVMVQRRRMAA
ncbi:IPTL-CTERM sorting domain-containing protein [Brevundimonas bullata]